MLKLKTMSQKLRYFVKLDREGTPVAGSNIARTKTPKVGVWQEIFKNTCCGDEVVIDIADLELGSGILMTVTCDDGPVYTFDLVEDFGTVTITELVNILNDRFPFVGKFWASAADEITVKLESNFQSGFCSDGTVTITLVET